jgi:hypothetical protein
LHLCGATMHLCGANTICIIIESGVGGRGREPFNIYIYTVHLWYIYRYRYMLTLNE